MDNLIPLTDDYVADLLAKDAKASSIKYSSMGLEAYAKPSKPPTNKPKPNTRFLRNIIRDTDNHNRELLAKEAAESRARLQSLSSGERLRRFAPGDIRKRQLGDIASILGGGPVKRRRVEDREVGSKDESEEGDERKKRRYEEDGDRFNRQKDGTISLEKLMSRKRESGRLKDEDEEEELERIKPRERRKREEDEEDADRSSKRKEHRRRRESLSEDRKDDHKQRHRSRSRSPRGHRSKESRHRDRSPREKRKRSVSPNSGDERKSSRRFHRRASLEERKPKHPISSKIQEFDDDSDPLDEIIGPRPASHPQPMRIRGRGAISLGSGLDSRFASDYDPTADVQLEPEEDDDWGLALEALRDRQKWQKQGADRLREAGFTEQEIKKWETGGEKREEDVTWKSKGEKREWDRGKVVGEDGTVGFETPWGRLMDD